MKQHKTLTLSLDASKRIESGVTYTNNKALVLHFKGKDPKSRYLYHLTDILNNYLPTTENQDTTTRFSTFIDGLAVSQLIIENQNHHFVYYARNLLFPRIGGLISTCPEPFYGKNVKIKGEYIDTLYMSKRHLCIDSPQDSLFRFHYVFLPSLKTFPYLKKYYVTSNWFLISNKQ